MMRYLFAAAVIAAFTTFTAVTDADEATGHLVIIGGGLSPDNAAIYDRLISTH